MKNSRIYFIDIVRAFAILMMLQGHFIHTFLGNTYGDLNPTVFKIWSYFRGITAPIFFTISGLIFTYLLLKSKEKGTEKYRMKKGITRGFMLIGIGYLIRIPFVQWFSGKFNSKFIAIDVLQCIGVSLLLIVSFYFLSAKKTIVFSLITVGIGVLIFLFEPLYRTLNVEVIPEFLNNYISKNNGSIFTVLPWFGYSSFGAFIATLFYWNLDKPHFKKTMIFSFFFCGIFLIFYSSSALIKLYNQTDIQLFKSVAYYNYLYARLGDVLICFAFFYSLEQYLKHPIILKIGEKTLSIYVIHFIIIYGSFIQFGLKHFIEKNLNPLQSAIGAILFLVGVCLIAFHYKKPISYLYTTMASYKIKKG